MSLENQGGSLDEKSQTTVRDVILANLSEDEKMKNDEIDLVIDKFEKDMRRFGATTFLVGAIPLGDSMKMISQRTTDKNLAVVTAAGYQMAQELEKPEMIFFILQGMAFKDLRDKCKYGGRSE